MQNPNKTKYKIEQSPDLKTWYIFAAKRENDWSLQDQRKTETAAVYRAVQLAAAEDIRLGAESFEATLRRLEEFRTPVFPKESFLQQLLRWLKSYKANSYPV